MIYTRYHNASHLLVALGIAAYSVAARDPLTALVAAPIIISSWVIFGARTTSPLPRWSVNVLLALATLTVILTFGRELSGVVTQLGQYIVWIQLIKLFEARSTRDQGQLLTLSLMTAIGAALTAVTLDVGLLLLIYAPLAMVTLIRFQFFAGVMAADTAALGVKPGTLPTPPETTTPGASVRSIRVLMLGAALAITLVAGVVFIVTPRGLGANNFGNWPTPRSVATTGFRESVQLGASGAITEDRDIVMEASLYDAHTGDPVPTQGRHYLRGAILDQYSVDRGAWTRSERMLGRRALISYQQRPVFRGTPAPSDDYVLYVDVRNMTSASLFTMWKPTAYAIPMSDIMLRQSPGDYQASIRGVEGRFRYAVRVDQRPTDRYLDGTLSPALNPPPRSVFRVDDPFYNRGDQRIMRVVELAEDLLRRGGIQRDRTAQWTEQDHNIIRVFVRHLERTCAYTLDLDGAYADEDPIDMFLFRTQRGHCEFFASALAAMCRAVGIDARVVTGFVATEYDRANQRYIIRGAHAHAWVEARTGPETWETFDPSPQWSLDELHRPEPGAFQRLTRWLDALDRLWVNSVVTYDHRKQASLLTGDTDPSGLLQRIGNAIENSAGARRSLAQWMFPLVIAVFGITAVIIGVRLARRNKDRRPRRRRRPGRRRRGGAIESAYADAHALLERAGLAPGHGVPPLAHTRALAALHPDVAAPFAELARLLYRHRYAATTRDDERRAHTVLEAIRLAAGARPNSSRTKADP